MKKTSTKKHLKRTAILASLIFGSLLLIACGGYEKTGLSGETPWVMSEDDIGIIENNINTLLDNYKDGEGNNIFEPLNVKLKEGGELDDVEKISEVFGEEKNKEFATHPDSVPSDAYYADSKNNKFIDLYKYKTNTSNNSTPSKDDLDTEDRAEFDKLYGKVTQAVEYISSIDQKDILEGVSNDTINHLSTDDVTTIKNGIREKITPYTPKLILGTPKDADFSKLYIKMSNLDYFVSLMNGKNNDDTEPVIENVNVIKKNGRTALDFTQLANADIKIDFDKNVGSDKNYVSFYRGGFKFAQDSTIELINTQNKSLYEEVFTGDFKKESGEKEIRSIFHELAKLSNTNLPTLDLDTKRIPGNTEDLGNLYGTGLDKILEKYFDSGKVEMYLSAQKLFDAKEALGEETMFNDTPAGYNANAHTIDVNFAEYLLNRRVDIKNVIIGGNDDFNPSENGYDGTLTNSVVNVNMNNVGALYVKGLVRFNGKSPKSFRNAGSGDLTKLILKQYDEETQYPDGEGIRIDISSLDDDKQIAVLNQHVVSGGSDSYRKGFYYLGVNQKNLQPKSGQVYIFSDGTYEKNTDTSDDKEYPNSGYEKDGNGEDVSSLGILLENIKGKIEPYPLKEKVQTTQTPLSRANNIKLTPVQKLLLDDQHIYG